MKIILQITKLSIRSNNPKFKEKYKIIAIQYQVIRCRAICFFLLGNTILTLKKILVLNFKISFLRIAVYKDQR